MKPRQTFGAVVVAVLLLFTAACGNDDGPTVSAPSATPTSSAPSASPTSDPGPVASASTAQPTTPSSSSTSASPTPPSQPYKVGQCLGPKPGYTQTSCSQPHTYEVFSVRNDSRDSGDLVKRAAWKTATCNQDGAGFFGSQSFLLSRLDAIPLPDAAISKPDAEIVCVAYEFRESLSGLVTNTGSLKNKLKGDGFYSYNVCTKGRPSTSDDVEVVSCKEPHSAEATGAKLNGKPGDTFPGSDKVQSQAVKFCLPLGQKFLGGKRSDIIASQNSGGSAPWSRGLMVTGCFVEVTNGTVKKSLRGIGNKPLDSYR